MTQKHRNPVGGAQQPRIFAATALMTFSAAAALAQAPVYYPNDPVPVQRYGDHPWSGKVAPASWAAPNGHGAMPMTGPAPGAYPHPGHPGQPMVPPPPHEHEGAAMEPPVEDDCWHVFATLGHKALARQDMGDGIVVTTDDFVNPTQAGRFSDLDHTYAHGIQAAIGVHNDCYMVELAAFHLFAHDDDITFVNPGAMTTRFVNSPFFGIFENPNTVEVELESQMTNAELNVRQFYCKGPLGYQWLAGVRYLNLREHIAITADASPPEFSDPFARATYSTRAENHLIGPQVGVGGNVQLAKWIALSAEGKLALCGNIAESRANLRQGDGTPGPGFPGSDDSGAFSQIYEVGLYLHLYRCPFQVKVGYGAMWLVGVAEAVDQINFDLADPTPRGDVSGSIFYHGPSIVLDITF